MLREKKQYGSTAETPPEVVRENAEALYPADGSESAPDREKKKRVHKADGIPDTGREDGGNGRT